MLIIAWIVCGVFAAIIASSKGRSFLAWLILGLLFGIFALLASGFMPSINKSEAQSQIDKKIKSITNDERKCPFCAEIIKKEAKLCKHCGKEVEPIFEDNGFLQHDKTYSCPYCSAPLKDNLEVCSTCGKNTGIKICPNCGYDYSEYPYATICINCHNSLKKETPNTN